MRVTWLIIGIFPKEYPPYGFTTLTAPLTADPATDAAVETADPATDAVVDTTVPAAENTEQPNKKPQQSTKGRYNKKRPIPISMFFSMKLEPMLVYEPTMSDGI